MYKNSICKSCSINIYVMIKSLSHTGLVGFKEDILVWLGWFLWHINHCRLFNAKSCLYKYIEYVICE